MAKILISNDDGILSDGILASIKGLKPLGDVIPVCPEGENSGAGRSLSVHKPLKVKTHILKDGTKGYGVSGTPADSVTLGIHKILNEKPDLVVSGINKGMNICKCDILASGTVGAAIEGSYQGIPSIAISLVLDPNNVKFTANGPEFINTPNYDFASEVLQKVAKKVLDNGLPEGVDLLNLNIPYNPKNKEIKITKLGSKMFNTNYQVIEDNGVKEYVLAPKLNTDYEKGSDGYCIFNQRQISLTPLNIDTSGNINSLKDW